MKFYIAGGFDEKDRVKQIQEKVKREGHEITADWTEHKDIPYYSSEAELAGEYAEEDFEGSSRCDVFVLIGSTEGRGRHLELGTALAGKSTNVFVIGEHREDCLFYFHPQIKRKEDIESVLEEIDQNE